jgi:uncharacterized SAM-binding protein YcdF (DUF218 family)
MRGVGWGLRIVLVVGVLWLAGFSAFEQAARRPAKDAPRADGIVALTGGAERVDTALSLLLEGRAPLLLISGVGHGAELYGLERRVRLSPGESARVTLGRAATSTLGNAEETAAWAQAHGLHSLIVVTAGYHMPRALVEIGRALPGVTLYPVAVQPPALRRGMEVATMRMLANEYDKYLAVRFGMTRKADRQPGAAGS